MSRIRTHGFRIGALAGLLLATSAAIAGALEFGDPMLPAGVDAAAANLPPGAPPTDARPSPADGPRWQLTSTLLSDQRRVAVINGRSLRPGESVDGARLVSVGPRQAVIRAGGRLHTLRLPDAGENKVMAKTPSGR